jgi:hypothetical protein
MTWWKVCTEEKKNVFEHELWVKDDFVIRRITGFRWGTFLVETEDDNPPVLDQTDGPGADAVDMYNTEYNYELDLLDDGWLEDFVWPDDMEEEERDRLLALWEEDGTWAWESDGWSQYDNECWFHGPLAIEKVDSPHAWQPGEYNEEITFEELAKINPVDEQEVRDSMPTWPFPTKLHG